MRPSKLIDIELKRLFPSPTGDDVRPYACIYIRTCPKGRVYIGQTMGPSEVRWHSTGSMAPAHSKPADYVDWKIVEGPIDPSALDGRSSYYIGFFNSHADGYNNTIGNHRSRL